ncbi:hypothetical protein HYS93_01980 [Candidatus Daviesbacteria bacterium]|nr:hypothetical protein [Candidatus Daviesbacteria bacterium]
MTKVEKPLLIIEGPQGSGKTTVATFMSTKGFTLVRGIPLAEQLIKNREYQNWHEASKIAQECIRLGNGVVLDRCLWSLVAFNMRVRSGYEDLVYRLGISRFQRCIGSGSYLLIILQAPPSLCMERNINDKTPLTLYRYQDYEQEVGIYQKLHQKLVSDGINTRTIDNIGTKDFLYKQVLGLLV